MVGREPETYSEKRLRSAKEFYRKKLKTSNFDYLNSLVEKITNRLIFIRYEVGSEVEAGLVFEVMNDRGRPLTQVDKIKNYLIYLSYKKDDKDLAQSINIAWGEIFRNLMGIDRFDEDDLLRYHWIMYKGEYKTEVVSDVHRRLKEEITLKSSDILNKIKEYIYSLKEASYVFKEINNPKSFFTDTGGASEDIRDYVNGLHRLKNIATFMPLLIASRIVFRKDPEKFKNIVKLCEIFAFRVYKLCNRRSDTKYSTFCNLAHNLYNKRNLSEIKKRQNYIEILNSIRDAVKEYGSKEEVKNNLDRGNFYYGWLESYEVKYLLYELEKARCNEKKETPPEWEKLEKKTTIEHIWAETPKNYDGWSKELKEIHEKHVHNLGNLTLTFWNPELSNKDFSEKKKMYAASNLMIQRELAKEDSWSENEIGERRSKIKEFVLKRWKLPPRMHPCPYEDCLGTVAKGKSICPSCGKGIEWKGS